MLVQNFSRRELGYWPRTQRKGQPYVARPLLWGENTARDNALSSQLPERTTTEGTMPLEPSRGSYDWVRGAPRCLQAIATYVAMGYKYKAIRTRPRLRPGPPSERASVHTYTADLGRRMSHVHRIRVQKTCAIRRGRFQCNNALCSL
jgi:hypothetical protein